MFSGACSKERTDISAKQDISVHGQAKETGDPNAGLINFIKNGKLANFKTVTIGTAFDSYQYLTKKEWVATSLKSKHVTVDFTGWFEPNTLNDKDKQGGITAKGLNVKFVIEPNGSYYVFMVSKLESKSDGKIYGSELQDSAGILSSIYANKKISL